MQPATIQAIVTLLQADKASPDLVRTVRGMLQRSGNGPARLTYREAAAELRCSPRTVKRYVAAGKLSVTRYGHKKALIPAEDVRRLK